MHTMLPLGLQIHLSSWCRQASFAFPVSSVTHFPLWCQHLLLPSSLFPFSTFRVTKLLICPGVRGFPGRMWNFQCKTWLPILIIKWHHYPYLKQRKLRLPGINYPQILVPLFPTWIYICIQHLPSSFGAWVSHCWFTAQFFTFMMNLPII